MFVNVMTKFKQQADELTVNQCAELVGVNSSRIRQLLLSGEIKGEKRGKSWFIKKEHLDEYLNTRIKRNY